MIQLSKLNNKYINIYRGKSFVLPNVSLCKPHLNSTISSKVIVFDLDETIGSFGDLYILWCAIDRYCPNHKMKFNLLLDIYPEFLRYGILNILDFLYYKKKTGECNKIFIYTKNQCPRYWVNNIIQYLNLKLNTTFELFDQVITSFTPLHNKKVQSASPCSTPEGGVLNVQRCKYKSGVNSNLLLETESMRTTQVKTHSDFIKCSLLPKTTEICFIDNTYYDRMKNDKVYYIKPKSYNHSLSTDEIIERFISSDVYKTYFGEKDKNSHSMESFLYDWFLVNGQFRKSSGLENNNLEVDIMVSQKIMYYIKEFFYLTTRKAKTKKTKWKLGKFTRKKSNR